MATSRASLTKHLRTIRRSTRLIARSLTQLETRIRRMERITRRKAAGRKPARLTRKRRAQLKLQGAYMGYMRQLKPGQKAKVKALKVKRGYEAAIAMARKLAA